MVESPDDWLGVMDELLPGEIYLLENIRRNQGEMQTTKRLPKNWRNGRHLCERRLCRVASRARFIVGIPKFTPGFMGFLFEEEVANLSKVFNPEHPFILLLGGAKFSTKLPLIEKFINLADRVFYLWRVGARLFKELGL